MESEGNVYTLRYAITCEMDDREDSWDNEVAFAGDREWLDRDVAVCPQVGIPFTLWTRSRVYFAVCIEGQTDFDILSVPRDPSDEVCDFNPS